MLFPEVPDTRNVEKKRPKPFVTGRLPFFWKVWFWLSWVRKKSSNSLQVTCQITFYAAWNCSLTFPEIDTTRKKRPICFSFHWSFSFFSKVCVFNNLLGLTEMVLLLAQYLSDYFLEPYWFFPEICQIGYHEKGWPNCFSIERLAYFRNLRFQQPYWC